ncbi:phosphoadenosine phosphosulfate reductase [Candidatus Falkowbacteria bacterium]|nr:phosphoadenosine phosphosulfate reductase [Candidatus Falkowbacteria bacterium]
MRFDTATATGHPDPEVAAWPEALVSTGDDLGYFAPLGQRHGAFFADDGPVLLVSFETAAAIGANGGLPHALAVAQPNGWSCLTLIASGATWFRDPAVFAYFDRLIEDAFFEDFDRVVFYGAGMAGYAAAAYSVAAPGAMVIAVQPQATLDPRVAGWDGRFRRMRRLSFTDRYGFAPDMIEGAGDGMVIFDPEQRLDAMHAALFRRPFVTLLPCPNLGNGIEAALRDMGVLDPMLRLALEGRLEPAAFWRLYRARRNSVPYLSGLMARLDEARRPLLNALLCRHAARRLNDRRFRYRLIQLEQELAAQGRSLPVARS